MEDRPQNASSCRGRDAWLALRTLLRRAIATEITGRLRAGFGVWLSIMSLQAARPLQAAIGSWSHGGPFGGPVDVVAASRSNPLVVYAVAGPGIFKTTDAGSTWSFLAGSSPTNALTVDPTSSDILFETDPTFGILRSTDGGTTWPISSAGMSSLDLPTIHSVAVNPVNHSIVFAGGGSPDTLSGVVYRSTDGGTSWASVTSGIAGLSALSIALDPSDGRTVYVGGTSGEIWKSTDGGSTWSSLEP